jgi:hypothetical protein
MHSMMPVAIRCTSGPTTAYRVRNLTGHRKPLLKSFDFNNLALLPREIVGGAHRMTEVSLMWNALEWGLPLEQFYRLDDMRMSEIRDLVADWEQDCLIKLAEIVGLINAIGKYSVEIEYDLICKGLRLRHFPSPECTWRDLLVILRMSDPSDRFYRAANPEAAQWNLTNHLLADMGDCLRWMQWAKTDSSQDISTMPKPYPRPGVPTAEETGNGGLKGRKMPLGRAKEKFDRPDPDRKKKLFDIFRN